MIKGFIVENLGAGKRWHCMNTILSNRYVVFSAFSDMTGASGADVCPRSTDTAVWDVYDATGAHVGAVRIRYRGKALNHTTASRLVQSYIAENGSHQTLN